VHPPGSVEYEAEPQAKAQLQEPTEEQIVEQPEEQLAEQLEEQTEEQMVEMPEEQLEVEEHQEIQHNHHRINHHLTMEEPEEGECLVDREQLRNWSLPNLLRLRNPTSSMEMQPKTLIPGGY